jgi:hypothetical protein
MICTVMVAAKTLLYAFSGRGCAAANFGQLQIWGCSFILNYLYIKSHQLGQVRSTLVNPYCLSRNMQR